MLFPFSKKNSAYFQGETLFREGITHLIFSKVQLCHCFWWIKNLDGPKSQMGPNWELSRPWCWPINPKMYWDGILGKSLPIACFSDGFGDFRLPGYPRTAPFSAPFRSHQLGWGLPFIADFLLPEQHPNRTETKRWLLKPKWRNPKTWRFFQNVAFQKRFLSKNAQAMPKEDRIFQEARFSPQNRTCQSGIIFQFVSRANIG